MEGIVARAESGVIPEFISSRRVGCRAISSRPDGARLGMAVPHGCGQRHLLVPGGHYRVAGGGDDVGCDDDRHDDPIGRADDPGLRAGDLACRAAADPPRARRAVRFNLSHGVERPWRRRWRSALDRGPEGLLGSFVGFVPDSAAKIEPFHRLKLLFRPAPEFAAEHGVSVPEADSPPFEREMYLPPAER
jgi:hypothetical protein